MSGTEAGEEALRVAGPPLEYPFLDDTVEWGDGMRWAGAVLGISFGSGSSTPTVEFLDVGKNLKPEHGDSYAGRELWKINCVRLDRPLFGNGRKFDNFLLHGNIQIWSVKDGSSSSLCKQRDVDERRLGNLDMTRPGNIVLYRHELLDSEIMSTGDLLPITKPFTMVSAAYDSMIAVRLHAVGLVSDGTSVCEEHCKEDGDWMQLADGFFPLRNTHVDHELEGVVSGKNGSIKICCTLITAAVFARFGAILLSGIDPTNEFANIYGSIEAYSSETDVPTTLFYQDREKYYHIRNGDVIPMESVALPIKKGEKLSIRVDLKHRTKDKDKKNDLQLVKGTARVRADFEYKLCYSRGQKAPRLSSSGYVQLIVAFSDPLLYSQQYGDHR